MSGKFGDLTFEGPPEDWSAITAQIDAGSMTLNALTFKYTNDEYSNLQFRTCMFVLNIETLDDEEKEKLNEAFGRKKLILGVVVEPGFDADSRFVDAVLGIAQKVNGLILAASSILDSSGATLAEFD